MGIPTILPPLRNDAENSDVNNYFDKSGMRLNVAGSVGLGAGFEGITTLGPLHPASMMANKIR